MRIVRAFVVLLLILLIGAGITYYFAGKAAGPAIAIQSPAVIGQTGALDVTVDAPGGQLDDLSIALSQGTQTFPVLTLANAPGGAIAHEGADRVHVKTVDRAQVAARPSFGAGENHRERDASRAARLAPCVVPGDA